MSSLDRKLAALFTRTGGHSIKFGLSTTRALLAEMDADPLALPCVHIAGTNGKGSTAAMIAAIADAAGLRTALYTSPHIFRFSERIRISGAPIPDDALSDLIDFALAADARQAAATPTSRPATFFELTTAIAFKYFLDAHVHLAVLETGMGGRLDATNVVDPIASVIMPIGLEHTAYLGDTLATIAAEKAGIIKPERPVVIADSQPPEALQVLLETAQSRNAPVIRPADRLSIRAPRPRPSDLPGPQTLHIQTPDADLPPVRLHLPGPFQVHNAAAAVATALHLRDLGLPITDHAISAGLSALRFPGRLPSPTIPPPTSTSATTPTPPPPSPPPSAPYAATAPSSSSAAFSPTKMPPTTSEPSAPPSHAPTSSPSPLPAAPTPRPSSPPPLPPDSPPRSSPSIPPSRPPAPPPSPKTPSS